MRYREREPTRELDGMRTGRSGGRGAEMDRLMKQQMSMVSTWVSTRVSAKDRKTAV
jgi:hypothetical protein